MNGLADPLLFDGTRRDSVYLQPATFGLLFTQARNSSVENGGVIS
jgi:hypothetical protein